MLLGPCLEELFWEGLEGVALLVGCVTEGCGALKFQKACIRSSPLFSVSNFGISCKLSATAPEPCLLVCCYGPCCGGHELTLWN